MAKSSRHHVRPANRFRRVTDLGPASAHTEPQNPKLPLSEQIAASASGVIGANDQVLDRLRGIVARLGAPEDAAGKSQTRPARAGRLGDIADKIDTMADQATAAAELLTFIETQI